MLYIGIVLKYLRHNIFLTLMSDDCFIKATFLVRLKVPSEDVHVQQDNIKALYCFIFYMHFITAGHLIRALIRALIL